MPKLAPKPAPAAVSPQIQVFTSMGNFTIELNAERAPLTVTDILAYVDSGHYTNTLIHRVVANFVIQGGGFNADYTPKPAPLKVRQRIGQWIEQCARHGGFGPRLRILTGAMSVLRESE